MFPGRGLAKPLARLWLESEQANMVEFRVHRQGSFQKVASASPVVGGGKETPLDVSKHAELKKFLSMVNVRFAEIMVVAMDHRITGQFCENAWSGLAERCPDGFASVRRLPLFGPSKMDCRIRPRFAVRVVQFRSAMSRTLIMRSRPQGLRIGPGTQDSSGSSC